jgi:5-methylcytosine-specific restriction endonuclease McrA
MEDYSALPEVVQARRLKQRAYYGTPGFIRSQKKYQASKKGKLASRRHARAHRERRMGFDVPVPRGYEALVLRVFDHRCAACGAMGELALDHHQPLRLGFPLLHNAVPLCKSCNSRKQGLPPQFFYDTKQRRRIARLIRKTRQAFDKLFGSSAYAGSQGRRYGGW